MSEVIPHWLSKQANLAPNKIAIEFENGSNMTFSNLKEKSEQFARRLADLNIAQGSRVGILSGNNVDMVIAIHALSYVGAVAVMLNTRLTEQELNYQVTDADVSLVLAENHMIKLDVTVITFTEAWEYREMPIELVTEINLDDSFTIMYTSGTTGKPKGVVHTYGNHWWSATGSALNLGIHKDDKWLAALPLFHIGGLSILLKSVIYGMPVYLLEKFDVQKVHYAIMEREVTIASVVTVMLHRLVDSLGEDHYPQTFRCMLLGGGPAPKSLLEKTKAKEIPVFQSYGMTETSSQIVTLSPDAALRKIGSAGKPLFPAQLTIKNQNDKGVGEIVVKGPMVTKNYYKNVHATEKAIQNDWLSTGDLGMLDGEGFLYVMERRSDLIISGGENVYPSEIESVLAGLKGIKEVGVTGIEDAKWGQVPIAFIVVNDDRITEVDVIQYATRYLAKFKLPKKIYFTKELSRNASNKLLRHKLQELIR